MKYIDNSTRIILKIGTSLFIDRKNDELNKKWLESLVSDIKDLSSKNRKFIIVASGALGYGKKILNLTKGLKIADKQAVAAVGQIELIHCFKKIFNQQKMDIGQILVTIEDIEDRKRFINARNTLEALLKLNVIPVINENDTTATADLKFGDNDRLAAKIAQMLSADLMIILSDIDGLYDKDPNSNKDAKFIKEVKEVTPDIEQLGGEAKSSFGTGGMYTKIQAAKFCNHSGVNMIIASGKNLNPLKSIEKYTLFHANSSPVNAKKSWIMQNLAVKGEIIINENAVKALKKGTSLLPVGVVNILGNFNIGDIVKIVDEKRKEIGRGICSYSAMDSFHIIGKKTDRIEEILGFRGPDELVHRNDLVIFEDR